MKWRKSQPGDGPVGSETKYVSDGGRYLIGYIRRGRHREDGFRWWVQDIKTKTHIICKSLAESKQQAAEWARRQPAA